MAKDVSETEKTCKCPGNSGVLNVLRNMRRTVEEHGLAKHPDFKHDFEQATIVLVRGY